jgi:hypothetical protein
MAVRLGTPKAEQGEQVEVTQLRREAAKLLGVQEKD